MLKTKLIFVDGCLPGSGKSTTSQMIALQLKKHNIATQWLYESEDPHLRYLQQDAQEQLPARRDTLAQKSLQSWQACVDSARHTGGIAVVDSAMLQHPLVVFLSSCEDMFTNGQADQEWLAEYYDKVQNTIQALSPLLIYLCHAQTAEFMHRVCAERGPEWSQWYINTLTNSPYGQHMNCHGLEGAIAVLEAFRLVGLNLFARLTIPKIAIDVSANDWPTYYEQIMDFVGLPLKKPGLHQPLGQFVGVYKEKDTDLECVVQLEAGQLSINNLWPYLPGFAPLVHHTDHSFFIKSAPIEVLFEQTEKSWRLRIVEHYGERQEKTLLKHT